MQVDSRALDKLICDLSYVFQYAGIKDLKLCLNGRKLFFVQEETHLQFPRNGFYDMDKDRQRYCLNHETCKSILLQNGLGMDRLSSVHTMLSLANLHRAFLERTTTADLADYNRPISAYETSIKLSGDQSALKMLDMISSRPRRVTFCASDSAMNESVPVNIRMAVGEAFAGLALAATHQGRWHQAVGFSFAALFKYEGTLPMVNCSRVMAAAMCDFKAMLNLTEMVVLPFYLRTGKSELYEKELKLWGPKIGKLITTLPKQLALTAESLPVRFAGRNCGVIKGKLKHSLFVEKVCAICQKGTRQGEKVMSCINCGMIYYCSKECQRVHWPQHKPVCLKHAY